MYDNGDAAVTLESGKTYIEKLRATTQARHTNLAQTRLRNMLAGMDLYLSGLSAAAIVCIRHFRDPLPGSLPLPSSGLRPPAAWEQAVRTSLEAMVRHAARPAREAVPANAEAVLFTDRSEWLACLAKDWLAGQLTLHWWWQSLRKTTELGHAVVSTWLEAPTYVPAALHQLTEGGAAVQFIRTIPAPEVQTLLRSLVERFALFGFPLSLFTTSGGYDPVLSDMDSDNRLDNSASGLSTQHLALSTLHPPPWQRWAPEAQSPGLGREQRLLLAVGLLLQRTPTLVRSPGFAQAVCEWSRAERRSSEAVLTETPGAALTVAEQPHVRENRRQDHSHLKEPAASSAGERRNSLEQAELPRPQPNDLTLILTVPAPVQLDSTAQRRDEQPPEPAGRSETSAATTARPAAFAQIEETFFSTGVRIETAFGGLFYLVNLALYLDLYGDFSTPAHPGIGLSPWDFVALVGRELIGEQLEADPVWPLLAELARRSEHEPPGHDFSPPDEWRVPIDWLKPFPDEGVWRWTADDRRLHVHHPAGFCLLDIPREGSDPMEQLSKELQAYGSPLVKELLCSASLVRSSLLAGEDKAGEELRRWLHWLLPYIHARLQRALGLTEEDNLGNFVCSHQAQVFVTATHVDVVLSLAELPVAIRCAGLDRDPGWIPAAGRYLAFHFEQEEM